MIRRPIRKLRVSGDRGEIRTEVLFDSGSTRSVIRTQLARKIATTQSFAQPIPFRMAQDGPVAESREWTVLEVWINGKRLEGKFAVMEKLKSPVVLGADFMSEWDVHLHMRGNGISVGVDPADAYHL